MNIASKVGSRIRILREAAGLTQSELAATAYVTRQSVGNWERGNTLPDVQSLQLVAKALNTTVDGLLGDEASHCVPPGGSWLFVKKLLACLAHVE